MNRKDQQKEPNYSYSMLVDRSIKPKEPANPDPNFKKNPLIGSTVPVSALTTTTPTSLVGNSNDTLSSNITKLDTRSELPRLNPMNTKPITSINNPRNVQNNHPQMSFQEPKKERSLLSQVAASAASITSAASMTTKQAARATFGPFTPQNKDKKPKLDDINGIESRRVHTWVRDSTIHNCYSCKVGFTLINRKHHCRLCGRIFCSDCTKYRQKIPIFLANYLPKRTDESPSISRLISDSDKTLGTTYKNIKAAMKSNPMANLNSSGSSSLGNSGTLKGPSQGPIQGPIQDPIQIPNKVPNYGTMRDNNMVGKSPTTTILMGQYMDSTNPQLSPSGSSDSLSGEGMSTTSGTGGGLEGNEDVNVPREVESDPQRLCKPCFIRLNELTHLRYLIDLFGVAGTTIKDLKTYSLVCKDWSQIASYHLSSFREMQYYLPNHKFSRYDRQMLWDNRIYLLNHGTWMTQLIRSIDYNIKDNKIKELISLLGLSEQEKTIIDVKPELGLGDTLDMDANFDFKRQNIRCGKPEPRNEHTMQEFSTSDSFDPTTCTEVTTSAPVVGVEWPYPGDGVDGVGPASPKTGAKTRASEGQTNLKKKTSLEIATCATCATCSPCPGPWDEGKGVVKDEGMAEGEATCRTISSKRLSILPNTSQKVSCWSLMCTRTCQKNLRAEDAVILLDYHTQCVELRTWAMSELLKTDLDELRCYLPILVHHIRYESIEQSVIGKGLINLVAKKRYKGLSRPYQLLLANDLYWQLTVATENRTYHQTYRYFLDQFCNNMDSSVLAIIFKGKATNSLMYSTTTPSSSNSNSFVSSRSSVNSSLSGKRFTEEQIKHVLSLSLKNDPIYSPTNPFLDYLPIEINKIKQTDSNSRPVILPCRIKAPTGNVIVKNLLYKNEDLRKDKIIMNLIKLANLILKKEEDLDLGLITYEICPTTASNGFLEMVPRSKTLYDIKERLNLSINNYIDSYNDSISVQNLRTRFVRSCAGYCVITYLLGIGDRHLDNIMITEDGYIFHIDYGFILGADPKPMTKPKMRLTDEMVLSMGGTDSKYYQEFKEISNRTYNCLRRHIGLFISMLDLLTDADPPIENKVEITRELLLREINKRFVPGETYSEAQVLLETEIENSNQTYTHAINDFFHYHAKEKTLKTVAGKAFGSTFKSIKGFFS